MGSPFKTATFKSLSVKWNKILKESGHKEIEDFSLPVPALIDWHNLNFRSINPDVFKARQQYYEKARSLLHTYEFKNLVHRRIWEMHSEGAAIREIAKTLKLKKYKKSTVFKILKSIQREIK